MVPQLPLVIVPALIRLLCPSKYLMGAPKDTNRSTTLNLNPLVAPAKVTITVLGPTSVVIITQAKVVLDLVPTMNQAPLTLSLMLVASAPAKIPTKRSPCLAASGSVTL